MIRVPRPTPVIRNALWAAGAVCVLIAYGPWYVGVAHPAPGRYSDFVQEWLSARNFWAGDPVYLPQREAMLRREGHDNTPIVRELPWNAHPPVAVLAALPFGLIPDYRTAHLVWNLLTAPLIVASVVIVARELRAPLAWWWVFPGTLFLVMHNPFYAQLWQAQLNLPILILLVLGWAADRRGYQVGAGVAVGLAAAMKVFPGLVLVYFAAAGRWRAVAAAVAAGLVASLAALAAFGAGAFVTYIRDALPSLEVFRGSIWNLSLTGYWTRVCRALGVAGAAPVLAGVCQAAVVGTVWWAGRRATSEAGCDRAFALAVVGMLLASPLTWTHGFVLLALPLGILWWRLPPGWWTAALVVLLPMFWVPDKLFLGWVFGRAVSLIPSNEPAPGGLALALTVSGLFTYALVALFVLTATAPLTPPGAAGETAADPD